MGVFPACAGMFPWGSFVKCATQCFPRVRGDVPITHLSETPLTQFSPRARGCSLIKNFGSKTKVVFPACAGMFRWQTRLPPRPSSFPRVRGDVPDFLALHTVREAFSPRARGCSRLCHLLFVELGVFPACAGMFLPSTLRRRQRSGFPRVRGDVPPLGHGVPRARKFSPRARGCSGRNDAGPP